MYKIMVGTDEYIFCAKCEKYKSPESFKVKGKKQPRKSCNVCRKNLTIGKVASNVDKK